MKSSSKLIMAATLVMVVSLAMVLGLVLVLLAELYCSLLLRRRRRQLDFLTSTTTAAATTATTYAAPTDPSTSQSQGTAHSQSASPLFSFYNQGVLQAPRNFLFPLLPSPKETSPETKTNLSKLHQVLDIHTQEPNTSPRTEPASPEMIQEIEVQPIINNTIHEKPANCLGAEHFVYISNPIFSNDATSKPDTPFETPDSSPSRLETGGCSDSSSGDDDEETGGCGVGGSSPVTTTPPLTPMKKLPEKACSVSLRSLGTSGSDSNSKNGGSSSSSGSLCTSPSW